MLDPTAGYLSCLVACLGFGSCYLPAKKVDLRGGARVFTLALSVGILLVGLLHWIYSGFYKFEPFAMLGGAIWAVGNFAVPFIVHRCGLGVGQLVWSSTNMLTGWATGTFGLFGKTPDHVGNAALNYCGVAFAVLPLGLFALMDPPESTEADAKDAEKPLAAGARKLQYLDAPEGPAPSPSPGSAGGFGAGLAVALSAGVLFGSTFTPPTILQEQGMADVTLGLTPRHSPVASDYVISHFCGIFLTTLAIFVASSVLSPPERELSFGREVVMPGILAGILWGVAQVGWFIANSTLPYVVTFPIIVGVPTVLAALWGVVLFGENRCWRNRVLLGSVILVQAVAVTLIVRSKGHASG